MNLISVVLGTPSIAQRDASTLAVLRYGFAGFIRLHAGARRAGRHPPAACVTAPVRPLR